MKALTLIQPWASLIVFGPKRIENRGWEPPRELIGERFAIHAGKSTERWALDTYHLRISREGLPLPSGAIIGTVKLEGIVHHSANEFFAGPIGWVLEDIRPLKTPIPCRGALGLWEIPAEVLAAMEAAV